MEHNEAAVSDPKRELCRYLKRRQDVWISMCGPKRDTSKKTKTSLSKGGFFNAILNHWILSDKKNSYVQYEYLFE